MGATEEPLRLGGIPALQEGLVKREMLAEGPGHLLHLFTDPEPFSKDEKPLSGQLLERRGVTASPAKEVTKGNEARLPREDVGARADALQI